MYNNLFKTVISFVESGGGDGDGIIISLKYEELAWRFHAFVSSDWRMSDPLSREVIHFSRGMELVSFYDVGVIDGNNRSPDILVKIF